jgi:hypothetical protein
MDRSLKWRRKRKEKGRKEKKQRKEREGGGVALYSLLTHCGENKSVEEYLIQRCTIKVHLFSLDAKVVHRRSGGRARSEDNASILHHFLSIIVFSALS